MCGGGEVEGRSGSKQQRERRGENGPTNSLPPRLSFSLSLSLSLTLVASLSHTCAPQSGTRLAIVLPSLKANTQVVCGQATFKGQGGGGGGGGFSDCL